jgi:hypothetical protein
MLKLSRIAPATIPRIDTRRIQPADKMVAALTLAPSSNTAISRSSFALKLIPGFHLGPGVQTVRTAAPIRIANTNASNQERPATISSSC